MSSIRHHATSREGSPAAGAVAVPRNDAHTRRMTDRVHTVVVGAGVVGLAIARAEAMAGRDVVILEAADRIGTGTSSRNSEVLHAGIFHPPDALKTRFC